MADLIVEKLDAEWSTCQLLGNFSGLGKILRSKVNILKASGQIGAHKEALTAAVRYLEDALPGLKLKDSLQVIGDLRHVRKNLSLSGSEVGTAYRAGLSDSERARFKRRNQAPKLGRQAGTQLSAGNITDGAGNDLLVDGVGDERP